MRYENFALTFEDQQLLNKYHSRVHEAEQLTNDCYKKPSQGEICKGNDMLNPIARQYLKQIPSQHSINKIYEPSLENTKYNVIKKSNNIGTDKMSKEISSAMFNINEDLMHDLFRKNYDKLRSEQKVLTKKLKENNKENIYPNICLIKANSSSKKRKKNRETTHTNKPVLKRCIAHP